MLWRHKKDNLLIFRDKYLDYYPCMNRMQITTYKTRWNNNSLLTRLVIYVLGIYISPGLF